MEASPQELTRQLDLPNGCPSEETPRPWPVNGAARGGGEPVNGLETRRTNTIHPVFSPGAEPLAASIDGVDRIEPVDSIDKIDEIDSIDSPEAAPPPPAHRRIEQSIIDATDLEKQRIGRELRENFCQQLVGISLMANILHEELTKAGIEEAEYAREISGLTKAIVSQIRELEKQLSVLHLEHGLGLVGALESLAEQTRAEKGVECAFTLAGDAGRLDDQTSMYLYRIAQDLLANAVNHAVAQRIAIRLSIAPLHHPHWPQPRRLTLSVQDNGRDDTAALPLHFPMVAHRLRAIGGAMTVEHFAGGGKAVVCTLPLDENRRESTLVD